MSLLAPHPLDTIERLVGRHVTDGDVPTPLVYIDTDVLARNLQSMASAARESGVVLRPHTKSHKLAPVAAMQLDLGAVGLTVAKLSEAIALAAVVDVPSVMIAQPYIGGGRLDQHLALAREREVLLCIDDIGLAGQLGDAASARNARVDLVLIVDTGYGRLGVQPSDAAQAAVTIASMRGVRFRGIRSHSGHAYSVDGIARRRIVAREDAAAMVAVAEEIARRGVGCPIVSVGSTPGTIGIDEPSAFVGVTEWRPGNYAFFDRSQQAFGAALADDCALTVISSVISVPDTRRARIDAGKKTFTSTPAPGRAGYGDVIGRADIVIAGLSEECGWLDVGGDPLEVGDRLRVIPNHACELTNLVEVVAHGTHGIIEGAWTPVARGKVW